MDRNQCAVRLTDGQVEDLKCRRIAILEFAMSDIEVLGEGQRGIVTKAQVLHDGTILMLVSPSPAKETVEAAHV